MGYETDTVTFFNTTWNATGTFNSPSFGATDWQRGYLYAVCGTVTGTTPTFLPFFQVSPDNGTTWIGASGAAAAGLITNTLQGNGTTITAITASTGASFIIPVWGISGQGFPGSQIRLAVTVGGTTPVIPIRLYGDFQKWVPDST